ncbi:MAG: enoyl-CoA hydratase/isomerase family protein [Acidimicrobiales bacterium]
MSNAVRVERSGAHVVTIDIDRAPVNALPPHGWAELGQTVVDVVADDTVRAVVLTGSNGNFSAGADIRSLTEPHPFDPPAAMLEVVGDVCSNLRIARPIVVAAIDGAAHGGGLELALACDLRIASPAATFAAAGVNMGLVASVASLIDAIGDARARRMLLTGDRIDADQAVGWGLVTDIAVQPLAAATALAERVAAKAPLALEATKAAIRAHNTLDPVGHAARMAEWFAELAATADHAEAVAAFLEKRPPEFDRR